MIITKVCWNLELFCMQHISARYYNQMSVQKATSLIFLLFLQLITHYIHYAHTCMHIYDIQLCLYLFGSFQQWTLQNTVTLDTIRILSCFSRGDDGLRKSNLVGEDDSLKKKKQNKSKSVFFSGDCEFPFRSMNRIQFLFNEDLFLKIKGSRILLNQEDQLLIRLIKIFQVFSKIT